MSLNEEQRRELVQLRLDNADSTIDDAQMLLDNDSVRSAMNRTIHINCLLFCPIIFVPFRVFSGNISAPTFLCPIDFVKNIMTSFVRIRKGFCVGHT